MNDLEKYQVAFRIATVPMLLVSQAGEIILANDLLLKLFGYASEELIGSSVERLVPGAARQQHPEFRSAYFRVPAKRNMGDGRELSGITRSGQEIPLELGLERVLVDGQAHALVLAVDIRKRKQQQWRISLVMDAATTAMIMVGQRGLIKFANKAAATLFGYEESELLGEVVERLVPADVKKIHSVYRHSYFTSLEPRPIAPGPDLYGLHRNGDLIPVEIRLTPVETPDGRMVVCTIIDLRDRMAAERALASKNRQLAELNRELTDFAYSASHDLKAPLATIIGLLNLIQEELEDGDLQSAVAHVAKTLTIGVRSANKIESLLQIAQVSSEPVPVEVFNLESVIAEIWQDLAGALEPQINLVLSLKHREPLALELKTLKVILENLVSNAVRYRDSSKAENFIGISSKQCGSQISIAVSDNGIGIPADKQKYVFDRSIPIDERSGSGLGLVLVKKHIDRLGGSISFTSSDAGGTQFVVSLPLVESRSCEDKA